ncbi:MAG: pyridoxal phosphate-dependent aminotransferase [Candidatus Pacebacteria bacterium]|nr:pyridoxal phosphate-dependent aminotransferase [Candidatus Paceibacterota bacterium]MCF7862466.1 pyridoxal phosphate-dependent aminotransferase [Candidatus Paceibacterota bacterium]
MQIPKESPTLALDEKAKKLQAEGREIINLTVGEPYFNTPKNISNASIQAIKKHFTHYTPTAGITELREAISKKFLEEYKIKYDKEEIFVGAGTKYILYLAFQILCKKGDEVIVASPTWSTYVEQIHMAGAKVVFVELKSPFKLKAKDVQKKISSKTKIILLNTPSNPTGATIDEQEIIKIGKLAREKNIFIISDEIYEKIIYEKKHFSIASLGEKIKENTLIINGFSKSYAMTGWRIGYACGSRSIIKSITSLASQITSGVNSIAQMGALEALRGNDTEIRKMIKEFEKNRNIAFDALNKIKKLKISKPEGAFYIFPNISNLLGKKYKTSTAWAEALLEEEGVAVVPGEAFYSPSYIRISYAVKTKTLEKGLRKINQFIKKSK